MDFFEAIEKDNNIANRYFGKKIDCILNPVTGKLMADNIRNKKYIERMILKKKLFFKDLKKNL